MAKKILLAGYYGFGNLGDDILLETYLARLRPRFDVSVLLPGQPVDRWSPRAVVRAVANTDILLFGGGGIFQDKTGSLGLAYYLSLILLARLFGKRVVLLGQGIGPLSPFGLPLTRAVLRLAEKITVRDAASLELLEGLSVSLSADSALLWEGLQGPAGRSPAAPPKKIVFIAREGPDLDDALRLVRDLAEKSGAAVETLPFQPAVPRKTLERLKEADLVVSMRLHGLILAAALGIPCIAAHDDPKILAWVAGSRDIAGLRALAAADFEWLDSL